MVARNCCSVVAVRGLLVAQACQGQQAARVLVVEVQHVTCPWPLVGSRAPPSRTDALVASPQLSHRGTNQLDLVDH